MPYLLIASRWFFVPYPAFLFQPYLFSKKCNLEINLSRKTLAIIEAAETWLILSSALIKDET